MKLKTVKDIDGWTDEWHDNVKAEAIKWVKEKCMYPDTDPEFFEFHNITEEDLK